MPAVSLKTLKDIHSNRRKAYFSNQRFESELVELIGKHREAILLATGKLNSGKLNYREFLFPGTPTFLDDYILNHFKKELEQAAEVLYDEVNCLIDPIKTSDSIKDKINFSTLKGVVAYFKGNEYYKSPTKLLSYKTLREAVLTKLREELEGFEQELLKNSKEDFSVKLDSLLSIYTHVRAGRHVEVSYDVYDDVEDIYEEVTKDCGALALTYLKKELLTVLESRIVEEAQACYGVTLILKQ